MASGDTGASSSVHIWDLSTFKPRKIFKGYHKHDVYILKFASNDNYLVVCGKRLISPVLIYKVEKDGSDGIILSTHVDQFVRKILTVHNLIGKFKLYEDDGIVDLVDQYFILLSSEKLYYFYTNEYGNYHTKVQFLEDVEEDVDLITCGCSFLMNSQNPELAAYTSKKNNFLKIFFR